MKVFATCLVLFLGIIPLLHSQDPHFSQFYANRIYLNPAYAGFEPDMTFNVNYRNQWFGIPDGSVGRFSDSYTTANVTAENQWNCIYGRENVNLGVALSAFRDEAGSQPLVTQGGGMALAYEFKLHDPVRTREKLQRLDLRIGGQMSYVQKSLKGDYFIYSNMLDPVVGLNGQDPATLKLTSRVFPSLDAGIMLRGAFRWNEHYSSLSLFTLGITFANVNKPDQSLFNASVPEFLPMRTTYHLGLVTSMPTFAGIEVPLHFSPQFRWDRQIVPSPFSGNAKLNTQTIGAYIFSKGHYSGLFLQYNFPYYKNSAGGSGTGSAFSKNTTTLILNLGFDLKTLKDRGIHWDKRDSGLILGLTYDINLAGLNHSNTLGVFEINLHMNFDNHEKRPRGCHDIGKFEIYKGQCPVEF